MFQEMSVATETVAIKQELDSMETETTGSVGQAQKHSCYQLVKKFSKEVYVLSIKHDLLYSFMNII